MLQRLPVDDKSLAPALILASGLVKTTPSVTEDSYPEGTCFFVSPDYVVTARHCGEVLRSDLLEAEYRLEGQNVPYEQHIFDPRFGLTWKMLTEAPFTDQDISFLRVEPVLNSEESVEHFLPWVELMGNSLHPQYPVLRMSELIEGELLIFKGFTNVEFSYGQPFDDYNRGRHGVSATGILGTGVFHRQQIETQIGHTYRPTVKGVCAVGQNSGGPVVDAKGRIVGIVSASTKDNDYTLIAPFWTSDRPRGRGRVAVPLTLLSDEGPSPTVRLMCDFDQGA